VANNPIKTMKNIFVPLFFLFSLVLISSCGKDAVSPDLCNATIFNDEVNSKIVVWQEAASEYVNDPSVANCNKYKTTGQAWLDAIRTYEGCATLYTQTWRESVDEAKAELAALSCN